MNNNYYIQDGLRWIECSLDGDKSLGFGRDYYAAIFREIERRGVICGVTFVLAVEAPTSLPAYGDEVILVLVGDEYYRYFPYFNEIGGIIRCYGAVPRYLDGVPISKLQLSALVVFAYRLHSLLFDLWRTTSWRPRKISELFRKTLHGPLGCFGEFNPPVQEVSRRSIDYSFLGSVDRKKHGSWSLRGLVTPPKMISRRNLLAVLSGVARSHGEWTGAVGATASFSDSVSRVDSYVETMSNCKIAVCPRGSNHETYRYFESMKAGCVVICERLPRTWFYDESPAIVLSDWRELTAVLARLLANPSAIAALSRASQEFWQSRLSEQVVAERIELFLGRLRPLEWGAVEVAQQKI